MTKLDLIEKTSDTSGLSIKECRGVLDHLLHHIQHAMIIGEPMYLRGFGTFKPIVKKEKIGQNITARTPVIIPAKNFPKFIPSAYLLHKMNKK